MLTMLVCALLEMSDGGIYFIADAHFLPDC